VTWFDYVLILVIAACMFLAMDLVLDVFGSAKYFGIRSPL